MNMIDKDAVLHMIDINIEPHTHGAWDSGYNVALSEMRERIKQMPTVEVEPVNDWISVKDRLPDECQEVLIYCPEFLEEIRKAFYTEGDFYAEKEDLIVKPAPNGYCTHWQPLPKPPKGE